MIATPYRSRSIRRPRRSASDIESLKSALRDIVRENRPMTVRQVFYQAVTCGLIDKSQAAYKGTIIRLLKEMRLDGEIPFSWIADNTRWMRKPRTYKGLADCLGNMQKYYRRNLWESQEDYVEIWLEKDALSGVLYEVTSEWQVPLMVTRGYPSLSFLASAAETIEAIGKPAFLYYFGDHDPSGVDIPRNVEDRLNEFALCADITFECVAVTPEQIKEWSLPTRPTKRTDSRAKSFEGESVEVDAIPPEKLRQLARDCILPHLDDDELERSHVIERAERETLAEVAKNLPSIGAA